MLPLEGQKVVITGAAAGSAHRSPGFSPAPARTRSGSTGSESPACTESIVADLSDDTDLAVLTERLASDTPDILVNIAGVMRFGLHESQPVEALELCYRVNLLVPAVLAQAVAGPMRARGSGQIVNIGSVLAQSPIRGSPCIPRARRVSPPSAMGCGAS